MRCHLFSASTLNVASRIQSKHCSDQATKWVPQSKARGFSTIQFATTAKSAPLLAQLACTSPCTRSLRTMATSSSTPSTAASTPGSTICSSISPSSSSQPQARLQPTRLALVQLGQTSKDKSFNLAHAKEAIYRAAREDGGADMVVLPECWNSPYGVQYFNDYAEDFGGLWERVKRPIDRRSASRDAQSSAAEEEATLLRRWSIDGLGGAAAEVDFGSSCKSESLAMLSSIAKELGIVLVGGSIPERNPSSGKLFNTATVFDEKGRLIAIHRKVHLFDIDIPGKMTFQESLTLTGGDRLTVFECCEYSKKRCV